MDVASTWSLGSPLGTGPQGHRRCCWPRRRLLAARPSFTDRRLSEIDMGLPQGIFSRRRVSRDSAGAISSPCGSAEPVLIRGAENTFTCTGCGSAAMRGQEGRWPAGLPPAQWTTYRLDGRLPVRRRRMNASLGDRRPGRPDQVRPPAAHTMASLAENPAGPSTTSTSGTTWGHTTRNRQGGGADHHHPEPPAQAGDRNSTQVPLASTRFPEVRGWDVTDPHARRLDQVAACAAHRTPRDSYAGQLGRRRISCTHPLLAQCRDMDSKQGSKSS